jgi:hypothetical protein
MLSAREIATDALNNLTELLLDLPIRTEIVPRSGGAIYSFYEATTAGSLRVAVSLERHGPGERIYFDVRREGPLSVWFDLSRADLERPANEFGQLYVRPAMARIAKCLRDQVASTSLSASGVTLATAAGVELTRPSNKLSKGH